MSSTRVHLSLLLVLACSSAAAAQENRVSLADVPLDFYALKDWGVKYYDLYHFRKKEFKTAGVAITERNAYPVARTPLETRIDGDTIVFRDYWRDQESRVSRTMVECYCNVDNLFSLRRMVVKYQDDVITCDVTDGRYDLTFLDTTRTGDWPKDTVIDSALLRLVTLLPRTEGTVYTFSHWSPTPELSVRPVARDPIRCDGEQSIVIAGQLVKCTKFVAGNLHTWVRDDGVLARIEIPGWKVWEISE